MDKTNIIQRWLLRKRTSDEKKMFFRPLMMSFGFLDVIFWEKGHEIDTYKPSNLSGHITHIWSTRVDQSGTERQN